MHQSRYILFLLLLIFLFNAERASAQSGPTDLQPGTPIERTLAAGQTHSYRAYVNIAQQTIQGARNGGDQ